MSSYLERYLRGEYKQVWAELLRVGEQVRPLPLYSDAWAVAQETMRRIRANLEILIPRLEAIGYQFGDRASEPYKSPLSSISPHLIERLEEFERTCGLVPLSFRACCESVGNVDFRGFHPDWNDYVDELEIDLEGAIDCFDDWGEFEDEEGNFYLELILFGDPLVKNNIAGVGGLGIIVPNGAMDAPLTFEGCDTAQTFVEYLRYSILECGGFAQIKTPLWEENKTIKSYLENISQVLIPF